MRCPLFLVSGLTLVFALAPLLASLGCSHSSNGNVLTANPAVDASTCSDGFQTADDAGGCAPILPTSACAPGTSPTIGSTTCTPVGVTKCPMGFATGASGWGCDVVLPPTFCTGATRDVIGSARCIPVGDCTAAFPPANATLFVDASFAAGQIDSTHFASVTAALAAATTGAVIAVESGTYSDTMISPTVATSIIGRCAEKVVFQAADPTQGAVYMEKNVAVTFSNMTFSDYHVAIGVLAGDVTLDSVVVDGSHFNGIAIANPTTTAKLDKVVVRGTRAGAADPNAFGLYVGSGANVTVTSSDFADNDYINVDASGFGRGGARLDISQSVVRDGHTFGTTNGFGWGVYGSDLVTIDVEESAIAGNHGFGLLLSSQSATSGFATATVTSSVVRGTTIDPGNATSTLGVGIESSKSSIDVEQTTIADNAGFDVYATDSPTKIVSSTLLGTRSTDPEVLGPIGVDLDESAATLESVALIGLRAGGQLGGTTVAEIDDSLVSGTKTSPLGYYDRVAGNYIGLGLLVEPSAQLTLKRSAILNAHTAGMLLLGKTTASGIVIQGTDVGGDSSGGRGVEVQSGAALIIDGSAFLDNAGLGVTAAQRATLTLSDSTVDQTAFDSHGNFGIGILLQANAMATISKTTVQRSAGPALTASASGATLTTCALIDNAIGVSVQDGSSLIEGADTGDPLTVAVSSDTIFVGNATRVGSGEIPLPPALTVPTN